MAREPLVSSRHRSSILAVTLATTGLLYHLSCAQVWFLEALRPRGYILVSVYHFPTDQSQLDQYPEYHHERHLVLFALLDWTLIPGTNTRREQSIAPHPSLGYARC